MIAVRVVPAQACRWHAEATGARLVPGARFGASRRLASVDGRRLAGSTGPADSTGSEGRTTEPEVTSARAATTAAGNTTAAAMTRAAGTRPPAPNRSGA